MLVLTVFLFVLAVTANVTAATIFKYIVCEFVRKYYLQRRQVNTQQFRNFFNRNRQMQRRRNQMQPRNP